MDCVWTCDHATMEIVVICQMQFVACELRLVAHVCGACSRLIRLQPIVVKATGFLILQSRSHRSHSLVLSPLCRREFPRWRHHESRGQPRRPKSHPYRSVSMTCSPSKTRPLHSCVCILSRCSLANHSTVFFCRPLVSVFHLLFAAV